MSEYTPDDLLKLIDIDPNNPTLSDMFLMLSLAPTLLDQSNNYKLIFQNDACKIDVAWLGIFLSATLYASKTNNIENFRPLINELTAKSAFLFGKHFPTVNSITSPLFERISYYAEYATNEKNLFDLDTLLSHFAPILFYDIKTNKISDISESTSLLPSDKDYGIELCKEINMYFTIFVGDLLKTIDEILEKHETAELSVDEYKEKLRKEQKEKDNSLTIKNPFDGKYIFRATKDQGGFVYTRSRADGSMSKYYVKDKKTIKLKSVESIRLVNCELTDRKVSFSLFSDLSDLFHNAKALPVLLAVIVIVAIILIPVLSSNKNDDTLKTISSTTELRTARTTTESRYIEYPEPKSGAILQGREYFNESELTITASDTESCVVKLKNISGVTRLSFYVRAGDSVTVGVPAQKMYVYFASGKNWYGTEDLFGKFTSYSKDSTICNFEKYTMTYTLYPVSDGNFSETPIDADEF